MMTAERRHTTQTMTLKQWGELPDDVYAELVDGVLVEDEMTTEVHDAILTFLNGLFRSWVRPRGGFVFFERKYGVARNTGRKPDVSVFLPGTKGLTGTARVTMAPADIAIEVITPTPRDIRRDRIEKRREYARFGIRWYWLVDPSLRTIEILELSSKGRYEHVLDGSTGKLRVPGCRGLVLDLDELWREVDSLSSPPRSSRRARG
jgi:Uma2 family endonuclease